MKSKKTKTVKQQSEMERQQLAWYEAGFKDGKKVGAHMGIKLFKKLLISVMATV